MKPSEVYRRAAELIASGEEKACCVAIYTVTENVEHIIKSDFTKYFEPRGKYNYFWFGDFTPENQRARELALYLMAEIAKELE